MAPGRCPCRWQLVAVDYPPRRRAQAIVELPFSHPPSYGLAVGLEMFARSTVRQSLILNDILSAARLFVPQVDR